MILNGPTSLVQGTAKIIKGDVGKAPVKTGMEQEVSLR